MHKTLTSKQAMKRLRIGMLRDYSDTVYGITRLARLPVAPVVSLTSILTASGGFLYAFL